MPTKSPKKVGSPTQKGDIIELGSGREETAGTLIQRAWRRALRVSPVRLLHSAPVPTVVHGQEPVG